MRKLLANRLLLLRAFGNSCRKHLINGLVFSLFSNALFYSDRSYWVD